MTEPDFYAELRALRLERVLDAAVEIIVEQGWDGLSVTAVAKRSGVPRPSLYKEVGTKEALGRAVVDREVAGVLARVREGIAAHPDNVADGLTAAARGVLEHARGNQVLAAALQPGTDSGLLALVTVHPDAVLGNAIVAVGSLLAEAVSEALIDTLVRLTMSHVVQPTVDVDEAVSRVAVVIRAFS